jgi:formate dehydrogenase subunit delta
MQSPEVRLANEIAVQFHHRAPDDAAAAVAAHIRLFWDPRMRSALLRRAETEPGALDPLALAAARLLAT